jgi:hypothetical protein
MLLVRYRYEISTQERFYKQEFRGCAFSLRDSNIWRKSQGIPSVKVGGSVAGLGTRYFEDPDKDEAEESPEVVNQFFKDAERQTDAACLPDVFEQMILNAALSGISYCKERSAT